MLPYMARQFFPKCKQIFCFCAKNTKKNYPKQKETTVSRNKNIAVFSIFITLLLTTSFAGYASAQSGEESAKKTLIAPTLLEPHTRQITTAKPLIAGVSLNDTTVEVYIDNEHIGNAWTVNHPSGVGNFYFNVLKSLNPGEHSIQLKAQNIDTFEKSDFSQPIEITIVTFGGPTLILPDSITLTKAFTYIDGVAHNNSTIHIFIDGLLTDTFSLGEHPSGAVGFHYVLKNPLAYGTHTIYLQAEDASGRLSIPTSLRTIRIVDFPKPTILEPLNKTKTVESRPEITGVAFNDSRIRIYVDGILNGETRVVNNSSGVGHFAYTVSQELPKWTSHTITAVADDEKGRTSQQSNSVEIAIKEYYIPPTLLSITARGSNPSISGVAHNDSTVSIFVDGKKNTTIKPSNHPSGTLYFNVKLEQPINYGTHRIYSIAFDTDNKPSMQSNTLWYAYKNPIQTEETTPTITTKEPEPATSKESTSTKSDEVKPPLEGKISTSDDEQSKTSVSEEEKTEKSETGSDNLKDENKTQPESDSKTPESSAIDETTSTNWPLVLGIILLIGLAFLFIIWYLGQKRKLLNEGIDKLFTDESDESFQSYTDPLSSQSEQKSEITPPPGEPKHSSNVHKKHDDLSNDNIPPPPAI